MFEAIIRRGTLTTVFTLIVCILGIAAVLRAPVQMIPDLDVRTITVSTSWSGATPQDIEKDILIEQEEYLRSIPGLDRMISRASSGSAEIELEFPHDIDFTDTMIRVNNALSQVPGYPENVDQPRVFAASFSQNAFMYMRVTPLEGNPRGLDMDMMRDFVDDHVRTRFESIPKISRVNIGGGAERQVQILLDPKALADRGITIGDVREAIRARNRDISGGTVESGKQRILLRTVGRFTTLEDLENLIIRRDGNSVTRLYDVAKVQLDHFRINSFSRIDGKPALTLSVSREAGSNVIDIKYAVLAEIERVNREVLEPAGLQIALTAEDAGYVEASVANVWTNLALGTILVTVIMYAFLRSAGATAISVVGIPICTIAAFLGLLVAGRTINVISLAGVAFALGMTIDNTIVVMESIYLERRRGLAPLKAAAEGARRVWPAIVASSLTTILVFIPILFIEEEAGQLYSDVAIAISASIFMSMLVAVFVVPTAVANIDIAGGDASGKASANTERFDNWVRGIVDRLIQGQRNPAIVILATLVFAGFTILLLTPPASYLPEGEEPKAFVRMNAPAGYNIKTMSEIAQELEGRLLPHVGADPSRYDQGESKVPAIKYMQMSVDAGQVRIVTESARPKDIGPLMDALTAEMESFPGMRAYASRGSIISSNQGGTRSVNLDISGPNLSDIYAVAQAAYDRADVIFNNPRVQTTPSTLSLSQPLLEVHPRWDRAEELGLDAASLGFTVSAMSHGAYVGEFFREDDKIDMYFYNTNGFDADLHQLAEVPIHTPVGGMVPLSAVVDFVERVDTSTIQRIGGRRTVTLGIVPPLDVALEEGVEIVREGLVQHLRDTGKIPAGVTINLSGAADQLDATQNAIADNYVIAVLIIYLLLVAILLHWRFPLLIMATVPLGAAAGIVGLQLLNLGGIVSEFFGAQRVHQPFDMISMLGFLILMGTVVNNPILIVHRMMENMKDGSMKVREAVSEAVGSRLRPIVMSTITTVIGLFPLVFLPGEGTELYRGVGVIVMFGLLGAAIASVTFLPALSVVVLGWRDSDRGAAHGGYRADVSRAAE